MHAMPVISVIIPAYNSSKTILSTIKSVLNQTFSDFELIIINDGSTDSTLEVIRNVLDSRIKIFSYPNNGVAVSRNQGIKNASGELIAFLDADDLWTPDKLELQLKALKNNPNAALAYSWTDFIDENGQIVNTGMRTVINGNAYTELLKSNFLQNGSNPLIHKYVLDRIGGFDESLPAAQDWDLYLRLGFHYEFLCVPCPQILYRVSSDSMSANVSRLENSCLKVLEQAYARAPKSLHHLKKESFSILYKYLIYRTFEIYPKNKKGFEAAKLFWRYIKNDKSPHRLIRFKCSLFSTILIAIVFPDRQLVLD